MEKVTDLNHGVPYTHKISPQGEMISNYTGYATAGVNLKKSMTTKEIAVEVRKAIKEMGFTPQNGYKISLISSYSSINITIKALPFQVLTDEYIEYFKISSKENKIKWIQDHHCNCNDSSDLKTWEHHLFNSDTARYGVYTPQAKFARKALKKLLDSYRYDDSDSMTDYFSCNFYGFVEFDWDLERVKK